MNMIQKQRELIYKLMQVSADSRIYLGSKFIVNLGKVEGKINKIFVQPSGIQGNRIGKNINTDERSFILYFPTWAETGEENECDAMTCAFEELLKEIGRKFPKVRRYL